MKFYLAKKTCQGEMFYLQEKRFFTKVYFAKNIYAEQINQKNCHGWEMI